MIEIKCLHGHHMVYSSYMHTKGKPYYKGRIEKVDGYYLFTSNDTQLTCYELQVIADKVSELNLEQV